MLAANYDITLDRAADYSLILTVQNPTGIPLVVPASGYFGDIRDSVTKQQVTNFTITRNTIGGADGQILIALGKTLTKLLRENGSYEYDIFADIDSLRRRLIEGKVIVRNNRTNDV